MSEMKKRLARFDDLDWLGMYIVAGVIGFSLIVVFWWNAGHIPLALYPETKDKTSALNAGTFGDSFGFINSLFSSLAFAVAMVALAVQSVQNREANKIATETVKLQRQERIESLLSKVMSDAAHVRHLTELYVRPWHGHCGQMNREQHMADNMLKDSVRAGVSQLLANRATVSITCIDYAPELQIEFAKWTEIPDQWDNSFLMSPDEIQTAVMGAPYEIERMIGALGGAVETVWSKYSEVDWLNTGKPNLKGPTSNSAQKTGTTSSV